LALYRHLLALRHREIIPRLAGMFEKQSSYQVLSDRGLSVEWRLGDDSRLSLLGNYANEPLGGAQRPPGILLYSSDTALEASLAKGTLPPWSVAWFLEHDET
jgi:hypothetical protein